MSTSQSCLVALILFFCVADSSAQIQLKLTVPGVPTIDWRAELGQEGTYAFNDDDVLDLAYFESDAQGNVSLVIQNGADLTNLYSLPEVGDEVLLTFAKATVIGYFDIYPSNSTKEIVLAEKQGQHFIHPVVLGVDGTVLWDGSNTVLLTVANMEADVDAEEEDEEVVVYNPAMRRVEVWGN